MVYLLAKFPTPHSRPVQQNNNNGFGLAEPISSGFTFHQQTAPSIYFISALFLTPKIHRDTGEVDSEVCFAHLCLPWLPTKNQAGDESGAWSLNGGKRSGSQVTGGKDKTPLRFKVRKPTRIEATSSSLFYFLKKIKTSLGEMKRKTGSVWAGIIELHSKQSAGRSDVPTDKHKAGGVPVCEPAPKPWERSPAVNFSILNEAPSTIDTREGAGKEKIETQQGLPLLSVPGHPYSTRRWYEVCWAGNASIKPEMSILLNARVKNTTKRPYVHAQTPGSRTRSKTKSSALVD